MLLDREHLLGREGPRPLLDDAAERPVALVTAGAAGDLRHLGDGEAALAAAVELAQATRKATCATSMLSPMPIASVATR